MSSFSLWQGELTLFVSELAQYRSRPDQIGFSDRWSSTWTIETGAYCYGGLSIRRYYRYNESINSHPNWNININMENKFTLLRTGECESAGIGKIAFLIANTQLLNLLTIPVSVLVSIACIECMNHSLFRHQPD